MQRIVKQGVTFKNRYAITAIISKVESTLNRVNQKSFYRYSKILRELILFLSLLILKSDVYQLSACLLNTSLLLKRHQIPNTSFQVIIFYFTKISDY